MKFAKMVPAHILQITLERFGHLLTEIEDSEFAYIHDGVTEMILDDARAEVESACGLGDAVKRLEHEHELALDLIGEIVTTLILEHNRLLFADFPDIWHDAVKNWRRRWRYLRADILAIEPNSDTDETHFVLPDQRDNEGRARAGDC